MSAATRNGLLAAAGAYGLWGFLPIYFKLLGHTPPLLILAHRIVWSIPTALLLVAAAGRLGEVLAAIRNPRLLWGLLASALTVAVNWIIYIWAVTEGRVLEGSLGYFINPLITFLFAALFFGERFNRLQVLALGFALLGVVNQAVVVGAFPWVALSLAVSFALYGVIRKRLPVDSRVGFTVETLWLGPAALAYLLFFVPEGVPAFGDGGPGLAALLVLAGPVTATPLILFAIGARRLRLSTIATLQYLGPTLQFAVALGYGETFTLAHAVTFGLIWTGVSLFTIAAWRNERRAAPAMSK